MVAVNEEVVLVMLVPAVAKLSVDDSHRVMDPIFPLKVKVVLLVPAQTVVLPAIAPPIEAGETVIVALKLLVAAHTPLVMTAL